MIVNKTNQIIVKFSAQQLIDLGKEIERIIANGRLQANSELLAVAVSEWSMDTSDSSEDGSADLRIVQQANGRNLQLGGLWTETDKEPTDA